MRLLLFVSLFKLNIDFHFFLFVIKSLSLYFKLTFLAIIYVISQQKKFLFFFQFENTCRFNHDLFIFISMCKYINIKKNITI